MRSLLPVLLLLVQAGAADAQIVGRVYDVDSNLVVGGALLEISGATPRQVTYSTLAGEYAFTRVTPGENCLRIAHLGYEPVNLCAVTFTGMPVRVDVALTPRPVVLPGLRVVGVRGGSAGLRMAREALEAQLEEARIGVLGAPRAGSPIGGLISAPEPDLPPGQPDRRRPHMLHIWGAGADRGRVLLDGAALNAPLHMGAMLPLIDPELLAGVDARVGGASPRHDGGTAQILDVSTRPAERRSRMWLEGDFLSARAGIEARAGDRVGVLAGVRRINHEIIDGALAQPFGYSYRDGLARVDLRVRERITLRGTGLLTHEQVRIPRDHGGDHALWQNAAVSVAGRARGSGVDHDVNLALSRGLAGLPVLSALGGHQKVVLDRLAITAERHSFRGPVALTFGGEVEHLRFHRRFRSDDLDEAGGIAAVCGTEPRCAVDADIRAVYAEAAIPAGAQVSTRFGIRVRNSHSEARTDLLPRFSISRPVAAGTVTLAGGAYTQAVLRKADGGARMVTTQARHLEGAFSQRFERTLLRGSVYLRAEGAATQIEGTRYNPGLDLGLGRETSMGTFSATYLLERSARDSVHTRSTRQFATLGLSTGHGGWRGNLGVAYAAGFPPTSIVLERPAEVFPHRVLPREGSAPPDARGHSHLRLDGSASAEWILRGRTRNVVVTPYVRVLNALGQLESVFYIQDAGHGETSQPLARLPAIPVLGVRIEF